MQVHYILCKYNASSFQNPIKILNTWISLYVNKNLSLCQYLHSHFSMTPFLCPSLPCIFLLTNLSTIINSSSTIFFISSLLPFFLYKTSLSIIFSFCFQISPFLKSFLYFFYALFSPNPSNIVFSMFFFQLFLPLFSFIYHQLSTPCNLDFSSFIVFHCPLPPPHLSFPF